MIAHAVGVPESARCLLFDAQISGRRRLAVRRDAVRSALDAFPDTRAVGRVARAGSVSKPERHQDLSGTCQRKVEMSLGWAK